MNLLCLCHQRTPEGGARSPQRPAAAPQASSSPGAAAARRRAEDSAPYLFALARAAGKAVLGLLLLGLAAGSLRAQEPDNPAPPNPLDGMTLDATNATMQVEDLVSALHSLQAEEAAPGPEAGATNGLPDNPPHDGTSGTSGSDSSYRRPSGRESRSRWSSRQRTNQLNGALSSGAVQAGSAATNTGPAALSYEAFRLIAQRNIFDPNRRPYRPNPPRETPPSRDPVYFTLVGTMTYEEGTFAFFSGSSSAYQKALQCSDTIAGYKLAAIGQDAVKLARNTNQVELRVGMQMRQDEDGAWTPSHSPTTYTVNDFQPASTSPAAGADSGGTESEILKRLMEKREKE